MNLRDAWLKHKTKVKSFRTILERHCDEDKGRAYYLRRRSRPPF